MSRFPLRKIWSFFFLIAFCEHSPAQTKTPPSTEIQKHLAEAASALRANQSSDAEAAYLAILKIDPSNLDARVNLGIVAMVEQHWAKAAHSFRKALKVQPSLWNAQALLGLCELHLEHVQEATQLMSHALPHLKDSKLRIESGLPFVDILHQKGELEKAASILAEMQELDPTNADILYATYRINSDLAMKAVNSLALAAPDSAQLHRALAEHAVNQGRIENAISEYRKALEINPNSPALHFEYGQALIEDSRLEASQSLAEKEFETALAQNPADARPECELGKIAMRRSDSKAAADHYERAARVNPDLACARVGLSTLLMEAGKITEALEYLEVAARTAPLDPEVCHRLAVTYRALGRTEDADREMAKFKELQEVKDQLEKAFLETGTEKQ